MITLIATCCLGLTPLPSQDPVGPMVGPSEPAKEIPIDGVAAVVGDELTTRSELNDVVRRQANAMGLSRPEDIAQIQIRFLSDRYLLLLKTQAGQDMGFDPAMVAAGEKRLFDSEVEQRGGPVEASKEFAATGQSPDQLQEYLRQRLYTQSWEFAQIGKAPGASGRIAVDRYIRPGQLWSAYQLALESGDPAELGKLGAKPPQVVLQQLVLPIETNGGEDSAFELAQTLIEEVRGGGDFTELVALWGAAPNDGHLAAETLENTEQRSDFYHRSKVLFEFASKAEVGELSEPMLGWNRDMPAIWVYMLRDRLEATPGGAYLDAGTQGNLRKELLRSLDQLRLRVALDGITDSVYVWPPSLRGSEKR
jgi:hypothetical protein